MGGGEAGWSLRGLVRVEGSRVEHKGVSSERRLSQQALIRLIGQQEMQELADAATTGTGPGT